MDSPEERLRARIASRGPIPFAEFMEEALYGEGGYYAGPRPAIGPGGDYVTGSSLSALFGGTTATLLTRMDDRLGLPADLLEAGFGDGRHLAAVRDALATRSARRLLAWDRVARPAPDGVTALAALDELVERPLEGLIFSYELFDALPVHRLLRDGDGKWRELRVDLQEGRFTWSPGELADPGLPGGLGAAASSVVEGQVVDLAPGWGPLYERLATCLGRGLLVTCDYGYERPRLLDARVRRHGTLACYRRQTVHRDPFVDVGSQDLTAHVDLTTLVEAGERAGLTTVALVSQAEWLGACGVFAELAGADRASRLEAARLLDLEGMGTDIKVLVQSRDLDVRELFDLDLARSLTPLRPPVE
jgi:SAM-dependent MidA family methyltransferase